MLTLEPGYVVANDFRIERALASGGMGAVYIVKQESTGRRRALKTMHESLVQDDDLRRRFMLEARVGSRIQSAHVVETLSAGIDERSGLPWLVMELLEGEDLDKRLRRGPLDLGSTKDLFRQLCHGVGAAHAAGVVHRDLKPVNVFLGEPRAASGADFEVKVLDFGIAKLTQEWASLASRSRPAPMTAPGEMMGTPRWMAPEQSDSVAITSAADVWALGLILYSAVTGKSFWRFRLGAPLTESMREVLFEPIAKPTARAREQGVSFPDVLEPIFERCVTREPTHRYRDATSLWFALDAWLTA